MEEYMLVIDVLFCSGDKVDLFLYMFILILNT